jgi:hypothetical protein
VFRSIVNIAAVGGAALDVAEAFVRDREEAHGMLKHSSRGGERMSSP